MPARDPQSLAEAALAGERLALARLLTQLENGTPTGRAALERLFPATGQAHLIGVTGAPGTGKSSLVNALARYLRGLPDPPRLAIVAVDPSSPFSGGAILGDRVRMRDLSGDPGVFIRSMASRGSLGGLATATAAVVQALDAVGFPLILIETVGAGQAEVEIARLAHTTLVVEAPGLGDDIQAIKAGILEIADVLVVNKADRPGVESAERALRGMLQLAHPAAWTPPVIRTVAPQMRGLSELWDAIQAHRVFLDTSGEWAVRERQRLRTELDWLIRTALVERFHAALPSDLYPSTLDALLARRLSPYQAAQNLIAGDAHDLL